TCNDCSKGMTPMSNPQMPGPQSPRPQLLNPMELFDLTGKVALVTGGSRGLGREMVLAFAKAGADVIIASRKVETCEELAAEVRKSTGQKALAVGAHTGEWGDMERLAATAYEHFGKVDVL